MKGFGLINYFDNLHTSPVVQHSRHEMNNSIGSQSTVLENSCDKFTESLLFDVHWWIYVRLAWDFAYFILQITTTRICAAVLNVLKFTKAPMPVQMHVSKVQSYQSVTELRYLSNTTTVHKWNAFILRNYLWLFYNLNACFSNRLNFAERCAVSICAWRNDFAVKYWLLVVSVSLSI